MKTSALFVLGLALLASEIVLAEEVPRFEPAACPFDGADERDDVTCGYLVVKENRDNPDSRTLRLAVAVLKSLSDTPEPDPLVFIAGGPGGPSVKFSIARLASPFWTPLRKKRDLVFFDQRGAGYSEPHFCEAMEFAIYTATFRGLSPVEREKFVVDAVRTCRNQMLAEGIDFNTYNSRTIALDLSDLRNALGYAQWNLFGVSYGTRVALATMRFAPEGVRSVIVDSTWPLDVPLADDNERLTRSLNLAFDYCAKSSECAAAFPNLRQDFFALLDDFAANPMVLDMGDPARFPDGRLVIDGNLLAWGFFQGFYSQDFIPVFPLLVRELGARNQNVMSALADALVYDEPVGPGLQYAVNCYEYISRITPQMILADSTAHPQLGIWQPYADVRQICDAWHDYRAMPAEVTAVQSSIPTLVAAGEFDPITPPSYGRLTIANLENATYFEVPGAGHGASPFNDCTRGLLDTFLDNPAGDLDLTCVDDIAPVKFTTEVSLNPGVYRFAKMIQGEPGMARIVSMALMMLLLISAVTIWPVAWIVRKLRKRANPAPLIAKRARLLAAVTAMLAIGFLIGLGSVLSGMAEQNPFLIGFGVPVSTRSLFALPWLVAVASAVLLLLAVRAWKEAWWSKAGRVHYLLVALACAGFVGWLEWIDLI